MRSTDEQVDVEGVSKVLFTGNLLEILWLLLQSSFPVQSPNTSNAA
jgi:hypothetical protein